MKHRNLANKLWPWLKANLGPHCLGCLTGQSQRALVASVYLVDAYSNADCQAGPLILRAWALTIITMGPREQELAYHAVAMVRDWGHRSEMWTQAKLPPRAFGRCAFE